VHARRGERHLYPPLRSPLAPSPAPADVLAGLLRHFPFPAVYAADLDAIGGTGDHDAVIAALEAAFAGVTFWVDNGIATIAAARAWQARHPRARLVLGAESQSGPECLAALDPELVALSLDFRGEDFLGPAALLDPARWPRRVIVMTLARIGAGEGPDWARLALIRDQAGPEREVYAAGGVRDAADLERLAAEGIAGVLVASALHGGKLPPPLLARFMPGPPEGSSSSAPPSAAPPSSASPSSTPPSSAPPPTPPGTPH
jgi:phosphoribosylformimino-5-aminoimidazole carboxamide ribotide isomerase